MIIPETIPATLEEAVDVLFAALDEGDKVEVRRKESSPGQHHFFFGMALRNRWNLWAAQPDRSTVLADHFKTRFGLGCADDMSGMILQALWAKVRGEPYDVEADAEHYRRFWRKQGVSPLTQEHDPTIADAVDDKPLLLRMFDQTFEFFGGLFRFHPHADPGGIR